MLTKIHKWGNSQGVRIPKSCLAEIGLEIGEELELSTKEGCIVLLPTQKVRGKYKLSQLLEKMPKQTKIPETSWGAPQGREVW